MTSLWNDIIFYKNMVSSYFLYLKKIIHQLGCLIKSWLKWKKNEKWHWQTLFFSVACFFQTYCDSDKCGLNRDLFHIITFFLLTYLQYWQTALQTNSLTINQQHSRIFVSLWRKMWKNKINNIITVDILFPNVHFILNKSTKTNIRYLQYLHGNVHFLWSFFQLDASNKAGGTQATWRSEIISCWIYI